MKFAALFLVLLPGLSFAHHEGVAVGASLAVVLGLSVMGAVVLRSFSR